MPVRAILMEQPRQKSLVLGALQFVDRMPRVFDEFLTHRYPLAQTVDAIGVVGAGEVDLVKSVVVPTQ